MIHAPFSPAQINFDIRWEDLDEAGALWQFHTAKYSVAFFAEEEDLDPRDSFCEEDHIEYAMSGDPAHWFLAVVAVYDQTGTRVGMQTLGGCSYSSFSEFYAGHRWQYSHCDGKHITDPKSAAWKACETRRPRREDGSRADGTMFLDMVRDALSEARAAATA